MALSDEKRRMYKKKRRVYKKERRVYKNYQANPGNRLHQINMKIYEI